MGWYKYVNMSYQYDLSMSSTNVFEDELEACDIPDDYTVADVVEDAIYHYDLIMSSIYVFEDELEASYIPDNATVTSYIPGNATVLHSNVSEIFKLEDPKLFKLCAQSPTISIFYAKSSGIMDGSDLYVRLRVPLLSRLLFLKLKEFTGFLFISGHLIILMLIH